MQAVDAMREAQRAGSTGPIVIRTDDAVCAADIPAQAGALGFLVETDRRGGNEWTITLRQARTKRMDAP